MLRHAVPVRRADGFTLVELVVVVVILTFVAVFGSTFVRVVEMSSRSGHGQATALSPVALLLRFAGLAVLLFGAGFWYLAELRAPGRLDTFRLGHFLLLALTYSLFFAAFAVLAEHDVEPWLAVAIAAAVSWPLLVLHVATIVDGRFALTAALPLAIVTTAIVVNGVYGGPVRAYVWLGLASVVVAHLTLTYPRLATQREVRRSARATELARTVDALAPAANAGRAAIAAAQAALAERDPAEHAVLRSWIEQRSDAVAKALEQHERLASLRDVDDARGLVARRAAHVATLELAHRLGAQLPRAGAALQEATAVLDATRRRREVPHDGAEHCVACGHGNTASARFCGACGARCAEPRRCRRCDAVLRVPLHLVVRPDGAALPPTHCPGCGERHEA